MAEQDNIQLVRKVYDAWNAHDPKRVAASFDETFVAESDTLPAPTRGTEGVRKFVEMYLHAFPDLHFTIEQILATGPYVITVGTGPGLIAANSWAFQQAINGARASTAVQ